ncbi:major facilitator transporter [Streptomyces noursei ZPM]|uniref:MFS transporter n=1 Tax=Streptomyces noursei TaxID=1971 RepID=A0A401QW75_STRNR|nr:MFS transporter [Streptomyces noursei]AKA02327.1 major facilitator transporter [Streptomyces noursei ZPM]EPY92654.1 major facilitator transporter [Streptomyces noursei CCRC 11814]EXU85701.1 major facilitator transporter [Streptomyces noursei PD-1]UWS70828.1 MFS transporter [Streptomyces noursei]GCB89583.1 MFS transporter [Streptomyces noursei]
MKTGDQIVQELPWKWGVQGKVFLIGGLGYLFDAYDIALNGFLMPLLGEHFHLAPADRGLVATANLVGMAVGAVAWGAVADRLGRKRAFSVTLLIFASFSVLGAFAPTYPVFLLLRFAAGVGLGGCIPVDYALVGEFAPRRYRGRVLTALDAWWPIGVTLCGLVSTGLLPAADNWRWMLAVMSVPALLLFWVRRGVPESPVHLAGQGREAEARAVIDALVARTGATPEPYAIPAPVAGSGARGPRAVGEQLVRIWAFSPRITSAAWLLFAAVMLVYYAALSWLPSILKDQGLGSTAAFTGTTVMSGVGIVGVLVSTALVDVIGRKWLIGLSAPLAALALVLFALVRREPVASVAALAVFGFLMQLAIPALYAYVAELYPTRLRASGFGWASSVSRVLTGFAPLLFGSVLWPVLGLPLTFGVLALAVVAAVGWTAVAAPETKGRALDDAPAPDRTGDPHTAVPAAASGSADPLGTALTAPRRRPS